MTQPMTTIKTASQAFKKVDLSNRLHPSEVPAFAAVNGYAQAQIVRPSTPSAVTIHKGHRQT